MPVSKKLPTSVLNDEEFISGHWYMRVYIGKFCFSYHLPTICHRLSQCCFFIFWQSLIRKSRSPKPTQQNFDFSTRNCAFKQAFVSVVFFSLCSPERTQCMLQSGKPPRGKLDARDLHSPLRRGAMGHLSPARQQNAIRIVHFGQPSSRCEPASSFRTCSLSCDFSLSPLRVPRRNPQSVIYFNDSFSHCQSPLWLLRVRSRVRRVIRKRCTSKHLR